MKRPAGGGPRENSVPYIVSCVMFSQSLVDEWDCLFVVFPCGRLFLRGTFIMYTATLGQYEGSLWKSSMQEGLGIVLH